MKEKEQLSSFQAWMQQQLLYPKGEMSTDGEERERQILVEELVNDSKRLSARGHLAIYQRSYIARLRHCMASVFSSLEYALGEDLFVAFADTYLEAHPSSNYNLSSLGANFADFLQATRPDSDSDIKEDWPDFMIELAQFEFAISILFDQEDPSNHEHATSITEDCDLQLCSVLELFEFRFPIRRFYSAFVNGDEPHLPELQHTFCVIIRQRDTFRIALYDLQPSQYYFLREMQYGKSVQEALAHLITEFKMDEKQLLSVWKTWKERWINTGFFEDKLPK